MKNLRKLLLSLLIIGLIASLVACGNDDNTGEETTDPTEKVEEVKEDVEEKVEEVKEDVEEKVEEEGLVHESSMELEYADKFKVDYYKDGYKVITDADGREFLLVPEGKEVPELDREMVVLQEPIERIVIANTVAASWFNALDQVDKIVATTSPIESWQIDAVREGLENGEIEFLGKVKTMDYELLEAVEPDILLITQSSFKNTEGKLDELGINYFFMGDYLEEDPRGRMEWVKFAGALLDMDDEAEEYYNAELDKINNVIAEIGDVEDSERPKVAQIYWSASKQLFRVTNNHGHQPKTTELAGGLHWPQDLEPEKRGGSDFSNEDFYTAMEDVDIFLYDEASGKEVTNKEELLAKAPFVEDLKAFQNDNIFMVRRNFWQAADHTGDIVKELHQIIANPDSPEVDEMTYYYRMK